MATVKVISLNCFGSPLSLNKGVRFGLIEKLIKENDPDIFAGQEVFFPKDYERIAAAAKSLNHHIFPEASGKFNRNGLVTLSRFPISLKQTAAFNHQSDWLPFRSTIERVSGRGYQILQLETEKSRIFFINTHLSDLWPGGRRKRKLIQDQVEQISGEIKKLPKNERLILVGDFNFSPASSYYQSLIQTGNLFDPLEKTDAITVSSENINRNILMEFFGKPCVINERVDYTLIRNFKEKPITQKVILKGPIIFKRQKIFASDHYGLLTKIEV